MNGVNSAGTLGTNVGGPDVEVDVCAPSLALRPIVPSGHGSGGNWAVGAGDGGSEIAHLESKNACREEPSSRDLNGRRLNSLIGCDTAGTDEAGLDIFSFQARVGEGSRGECSSDRRFFSSSGPHRTPRFKRSFVPAYRRGAER